MARQGLKQIGEHMNVVTRTMSADPSGNYLIILFKIWTLFDFQWAHT